MKRADGSHAQKEALSPSSFHKTTGCYRWCLSDLIWKPVISFLLKSCWQDMGMCAQHLQQEADQAALGRAGQVPI